MTQIRIDIITGATYPVDVYVSDVYGNNQSFLGTISAGPIPPQVTYQPLPSIFDTAPQVMLKVIDSNDCEYFEILTCEPPPTVTPSQTPTMTPTNTVTPTITPTISLTPSLTPTITPTISLTPSITPTISLTPSITPTITPTTTVTPTITSTVTPTPSQTQGLYYAYIFPEPQDLTSQNQLGQYMFDSGADWFGYTNTGGIPSNTTSYSSTTMDAYAHFSGWTGSNGNFVTNVSTIKGSIRQSAGVGVDSFGCTQNQYTFGTVEVSNSMVTTSIQYFYSIWIPLDGVGNTLTNMTIDLGNGASCSFNLASGAIPDSIQTQNVIVTSGAIIPSGTYRILWIPTYLLQPTTIPLISNLYFKGDTKT